jgi:hypothetical protein
LGTAQWQSLWQISCFQEDSRKYYIRAHQLSN